MAFIDPLTRDYVATAGHDLAPPTHPAQEALARRLLTERGSAFWDPTYGSTLHELPRLAIRQNAEGEVMARARAALAPLLTSKVLTRVDVAASRVDRNRVELAVRALAANGTPVTFTTFVRL